MTITKDTDFVRAMGKVASGLFIVTAADGDRRAAFLASFVQQVSFEPLVFSIACHPDRYPYELIKKTKKFGINVIPESDKVLMSTFAKGHGPDTDPLASVSQELVAGVPLLKDAIGGAVCEVVLESTPGDHVLFYGKAVDGLMFDEALKPWVHVRKSALSY